SGCKGVPPPTLTPTNTALPSLTPSPTVPAWDNLALTPPMGWSSFNHFGCNMDETTIKEISDSMISSGMQAVGYRYVNLDDCWMASARDAGGNLQADPKKFPSGIKALADYVHAKGLKLGIYLDRGTKTCGGYPGSYGHEIQDAELLASWEVDFLKYDNCSPVGNFVTDYQKMSNALKATGRPILFSMCTWGFPGYWIIGSNVGHMWRTTSDIQDNWPRMLIILDANNVYASFAGPGHWNDPDMLEVGNGGMSDLEYQSHFIMWAIMAAPLIAGNDLRSMSQAIRDILTAPEVIAVDQDALGIQGTRISATAASDKPEIWSKTLSGVNARAVALFNRSEAAVDMTVSWSDLGLPSGTAAVRDLSDRIDRGIF
ncbi:MAG TPA: glycoside hydrolase family 27 protein, partial [Anaerolineales bacterium]